MLHGSLSKFQAAGERKIGARLQIVLQAANVPRLVAKPQQKRVEVKLDGVNSGQPKRSARERRPAPTESKKDLRSISILVGKSLHLHGARHVSGV